MSVGIRVPEIVLGLVVGGALGAIGVGALVLLILARRQGKPVFWFLLSATVLLGALAAAIGAVAWQAA